MFAKVRNYFSLKHRRLRRKAEQERGTDTEEKVKSLLRKIKPQMYLDIKKLEKELVEHGVVRLDLHALSLDDDNKIFQELSKIELGQEDKNLNLKGLTHVRTNTDEEGKTRIIQVSASVDYMKRLRPSLGKRGIEMVCTNSGPEWYELKFTIEGVN